MSPHHADHHQRPWLMQLAKQISPSTWSDDYRFEGDPRRCSAFQAVASPVPDT